MTNKRVREEVLSNKKLSRIKQKVFTKGKQNIIREPITKLSNKMN